jgi:AcrR family transcriptional regulator
MADTRAEILKIAAQEFARRGYVATSVQRIATRVGLTKAAVLYHFPEKADLLQALATPLLEALDRMVKSAERLPAPRARWAIIEGLLDVTLEHRDLLRMSLQDLALSAATFERYRNAMLRANELVAGPAPSFAVRVRAAQAIAALGDPVVLYADAAGPELRTEVLRGVHLLLEAKPAKTRRRGRRPTVDAAMARRARSLYRKGQSVDAIAAELGVSRATAYRHL